MFILIPTGLIGALVREAGGSYGGGQQPDAEQIAAQREAAMVDARARELVYACAGPNACLVVVGENEWSECRIDGVALDIRQAAAPAPRGYRDGAQDLGPGPHGFAAVCPGRHVLSSVVDGRRVLQHFVLHPREACFLRLDRGAGGWSRYEPAHEQAIAQRLQELSFLSYVDHVAQRRIAAMRAKAGHEAIRDCLGELQGALHAVVANDQAVLERRTALAVDAIVGAPLPTFEPITSFIGFHVFELLAKGRPREATALLSTGLAVLPENPTLLGVLGELQLREGARDSAVHSLQKALSREAGIDPKLRERVRALLASA